MLGHEFAARHKWAMIIIMDGSTQDVNTEQTSSGVDCVMKRYMHVICQNIKYVLEKWSVMWREAHRQQGKNDKDHCIWGKCKQFAT